MLDKIIAFALRPNRIKNRDLWDVAWLKQQNVRLPTSLSEEKVRDHKRSTAEVVNQLKNRCEELTKDSSLETAFREEMMRFLPQVLADRTVGQPGFWTYVTSQTIEESRKVIDYLEGRSTASASAFPMS